MYRVARSPEQERPKQRGGGTTTERPKATLWRRTGLGGDGGADDDATSAPLRAHGRTDITPDEERRARGVREIQADDGDEGQVLAARWSDVTDAVERLLGFKSEQFRKVVLLPQGQFRRLLLASSTEREEIPERIGLVNRH